MKAMNAPSKHTRRTCAGSLGITRARPASSKRCSGWRADVDPDRIVQVIHNLMANAVRHTPPGGAIRVTLSREGHGHRVTVANTGPGIDPADLPFIFERFYRGDRSRSRIIGGSGLGLTIARKLVEAHGGRITAESRPGEETVFSFDLPR